MSRDMADLLAENQRLRERIDVLESAQVRDRVLMALRLRMRLGLSPFDACVLARLWRGRALPVVTVEQLMAALYDGDGPDYGPKIVSTYISHIRKRIGRNAIATIWGQGYALTAEGVAAIADIAEPRQPTHTQERAA